MSYTLGSITLPNPKPGDFRRIQMEVGGSVLTLNGRTKKDITARKEQYVIYYEKLTPAEVALILSEYDLRETRNFAVSESNLTISSTPVHIDVTGREYNTAGEGYREDLQLILTEVI